MKVFMSWSGDLSKAVAELLSNWIKCVVQATDPWISTSIDRGAVWSSTINNELKEASFGIVCLTHENKDKPWILFESGALAKGLAENRVCTFLIDLQPHDIGTPLSQFNATLPDRAGLWSLVATLNNGSANGLPVKVLEQMFEVHFPIFEERFKKAIADHPMKEKPAPRSEESILGEILDSVRGLDRRMRAIENSKDIGANSGLNSIVRAWDVEADERPQWNPPISARQGAEEVVTLLRDGVKAEVVRDIMNRRVGPKRAHQIMGLALAMLKKAQEENATVATE